MRIGIPESEIARWSYAFIIESVIRLEINTYFLTSIEYTISNTKRSSAAAIVIAAIID